MSDPIQRVPPQSLEAEKALLGALLLKPEAVHDVADTIKADSFYAEKHRIIYEAMRRLSDKSNPIDLLTVAEQLTADATLDRIGGRSYLADLVGSAPNPGNYAHYADLVSQKFIMRALIDTSYEITEAAYNESHDVIQMLDDAEKRIMAIGNATASHKFLPIKDAFGDVVDFIDSLSNKDDTTRGVPTGFRELDNLLAGLHPSDLIILAARPSVGKTSLALNIARHAAVEKGIPVGIFSLEMSGEQLRDRLLSAEAGIDSWNLRTKKIKDSNDYSKIRDAVDRLSKAPIYIDDKPGNNILSMRAVARRLKREVGVGLIIVDYLQLMAPTNTKASDSMVQQVTEISRSLKSLARELDVPVLALSQLSRAIEQRGGKPRLSDLRDSGSIEQDADVVMFIHRDEKAAENGQPNITEILIEKHRNGPTGKATLFFQKSQTTFQSMNTTEGYGELAEEFA